MKEKIILLGVILSLYACEFTVMNGCGECCDAPPIYHLFLFVEYSSDEAKNFITSERNVERDSVFFFSLSKGKRSKIQTSYLENWRNDSLYFAIRGAGHDLFESCTDKGDCAFYLKKMNNMIDTLQVNVVSREEGGYTHYDLKDFKINGENAAKTPFFGGDKDYSYWLRKP